MPVWKARATLCPVLLVWLLAGHSITKAQTISAEPNDLCWDLAENFEFRWTSAELSAQVVNEVHAQVVERTLVISGEMRILDTEGLVTVEAERPVIVTALDAGGNAVLYEGDRFSSAFSARRYQEQGRQWQPETQVPSQWLPFAVTLRPAADANEPMPSSLSVLEGYVYVLYADDVILFDVPFDPNSGCHETEAAPDLQIWVDPVLTPPCPGPLRYTAVTPMPGSPKGLLSPAIRPTTSVPLYKYTTWIKSKTGVPVMALRDASGYCHRDTYPLGDYAVLRTELYDSQQGTSGSVQTQETGSNPADVRGAYCRGQMEQGRGDAYDTIRHVIVARPLEVKIPFVWKDIPIPVIRPAPR